jgi:hypothetical protein
MADVKEGSVGVRLAVGGLHRRRRIDDRGVAVRRRLDERGVVLGLRRGIDAGAAIKSERRVGVVGTVG